MSAADWIFGVARLVVSVAGVVIAGVGMLLEDRRRA